jgi:hypothetical protein
MAFPLNGVTAKYPEEWLWPPFQWHPEFLGGAVRAEVGP